MTLLLYVLLGLYCYFNPHEREARDPAAYHCYSKIDDFNPHEREARDIRVQIVLLLRSNFNPHEREARDLTLASRAASATILIHTSVKLVTIAVEIADIECEILIHTSVKLVTQVAHALARGLYILIHTSVKLVTKAMRGTLAVLPF